VDLKRMKQRNYFYDGLFKKINGILTDDYTSQFPLKVQVKGNAASNLKFVHKLEIEQKEGTDEVPASQTLKNEVSTKWEDPELKVNFVVSPSEWKFDTEHKPWFEKDRETTFTTKGKFVPKSQDYELSLGVKHAFSNTIWHQISANIKNHYIPNVYEHSNIVKYENFILGTNLNFDVTKGLQRGEFLFGFRQRGFFFAIRHAAANFYTKGLLTANLYKRVDVNTRVAAEASYGLLDHVLVGKVGFDRKISNDLTLKVKLEDNTNCNFALIYKVTPKLKIVASDSGSLKKLIKHGGKDCDYKLGLSFEVEV